MANAAAGNSLYIDTTGVVGPTSNAQIASITVTTSAAGGSITLQDNAGTPVNKITLKVATDEDSKVFDYSTKPIVFPNGIKVSAIADCVATIVFG